MYVYRGKLLELVPRLLYRMNGNSSGTHFFIHGFVEPPDTSIGGEDDICRIYYGSSMAVRGYELIPGRGV